MTQGDESFVIQEVHGTPATAVHAHIRVVDPGRRPEIQRGVGSCLRGAVELRSPGVRNGHGSKRRAERMTQPRARLRAKTGICWQGDEGIHAACLEDRQRGPETCRDILAEYIRRF